MIASSSIELRSEEVIKGMSRASTDQKTLTSSEKTLFSSLLTKAEAEPPVEEVSLPPERLMGDADLNGRVDEADFEIWQKHAFQSGTDWSSGDFNGDGVTDGQDFTIWNQNKFTGTYNDRVAGDANRDGAVDEADFKIWHQNRFQEGTTWETGDFNGDGVTDGLDFNIWNENKELSQSPIRPRFRASVERFSLKNDLLEELSSLKSGLQM